MLYVSYTVSLQESKLKKSFFQIVINLQKIFQYIYWKNLGVSGPQAVLTRVIQGSTVYGDFSYY